MHTRFIGRTAALVAVAAAAVVLAPASPASAAVGFYRVSQTSASDSTSPKTITVDCDPGDILTMVSGSVDGGGTDVILTRAYTDSGLNLATASGIEANATGASWTVTVYGVCAPAGAISNLQFVESTVGPSTVSKQAIATCTGGRVTFGGGWKLDNAFGLVAIDEVKLNSAFSSVAVQAYNYGVPGSYSLTAQAICGNALPDMSLETFDSALNSVTPKTVTTNACAEVSGAGAVITGAVGHANIDTLRVKPAMEVAEVVVREIGTYTTDWDVEVQAICIG